MGGCCAAVSARDVRSQKSCPEESPSDDSGLLKADVVAPADKRPSSNEDILGAPGGHVPDEGLTMWSPEAAPVP